MLLLGWEAHQPCCRDWERVPSKHRGDGLAIERWPGGSGHCSLLPALMQVRQSLQAADLENVTSTRGAEQSADFKCRLAMGRRKFCLCSTKCFIMGHGNIWEVTENE